MMKGLIKLRTFASMALSLMLFSCISALGGCAATAPVVRETIKTVSVPVAVGCVVGSRPDAVPPLNIAIPTAEWRGLSPKQKAEAVAAQGLRHQNRADAIDAATGACQ